MSVGQRTKAVDVSGSGLLFVEEPTTRPRTGRRNVERPPGRGYMRMGEEINMGEAYVYVNDCGLIVMISTKAQIERG